MSSVANNTTAPSTAPSAVEAAMPVSPSRVARQRSVESGSIHVPHHCEERTTAQQEPLPRQNSSDDLDGGYRSSCEGSVPEEGGCHCSHENHSHDSSSNCPMEEAKEAAALSAQALAAFAQEEQAEEERSNLAPTPAHHLLENQTHNYTHTYHAHHRPMRSRPRSSVSTAAREEERQRLYAIPPLADGASASSSPAPYESAAGTSSARIDGKASRAATTMTPVSLADASAADSDCSSTDAVCHNRNPLFASTNMKTSAAMLHVALDSEIRGAASTVSAATSASFPDVGPAAQGTEHAGAAVGGAGGNAEQSSSADLLLRVFPAFVTSRHESPARTRTLSAAEVGATPLQGTLSRLSRSSSNDSSAVEASIEAGAAAGATSTQAAAAAAASAASQRSASLPPHDGEHNGVGDATVVHNGLFNSSGASLCTPVTAQPAAGAASVVAASSNAEPAFAPVITVDAQTDNAGTTSASASPALESSRPQRCSTRTREKAKPASLTAPATPLVPHGASPSTASPVTHVGDVAAAACVHTSTNTVVTSTCSPLPSPSLAQKATPSPSSLRTPTVDISSSSSVGGHHLSVTEGNAFLKQSGSRREEAFYNMIRPYQETLVREAVRQAPHTVEHWRHQNNTASAAASGGAGARRGEPKDGESGASPAPAGVSNTSIVASAAPAVVIRHVHADASSIGVSTVRKNGSAAAAAAAVATTTSAAGKDETMSLCEARWEAYQQYEAEDLSSLDILASAPLPTEEEQQNFSPLHRMRSESFAANSPVASPRSPDAAQPTSPLAQQVDKDLVELAARLWWTIRFQHFYRTSSSAYEVQRQAAEAASLSPPSPSAPSLAGGGRDGIVISRCSTPASQHRYPVSPSAATHGREDVVGTPPMPQMPAASPPSSMSVAAAAAAASHLASLSGTATPTLMGSFAALSSDGVASNVSQPERQYSAQKHRALQLLAAFVPRYYGTLRLFLKDVLRCERRGVAATVAAAAEAAKATVGDKEEAAGEHHNPLTDSQAGESGTATNAAAVPQPDSVHKSPAAPATTASAMPVPKIVDADDDDDDDDDLNEAGGRKICRMIMLEYVCYRFRRPCVMDIKMGSRQYGLHPTAEKKRSKEQKSKLSTSGRYGIRLAGYRRWNAAESRYDFRGKLQCRALTLNEVKNEISAFLMNNRELERVYRRQLQRLRVAFSQQTVFRFYTSSLLFVYDAEDPLPTARVTMVDFAYTYESKELLQGGDPDADFAYDVGYLKAIDTLLSLLA